MIEVCLTVAWCWTLLCFLAYDAVCRVIPVYHESSRPRSLMEILAGANAGKGAREEAEK